jgi:hypothetical protein
MALIKLDFPLLASPTMPIFISADSFESSGSELSIHPNGGIYPGKKAYGAYNSILLVMIAC